MARHKSDGTGLDRRNGRGYELAQTGSLERFGLPRDRAYRKESAAAWRSAWADPAASTWTQADRPVLLRWILHTDLYAQALEEATTDPIVPGHGGQPVRSPWFDIAKDAMSIVQECEKQLGIGGLNRSRLGLVIATGRLTLEEMNARLMRGLEDEHRRDPRMPDPDFD